MGSQGEDKQKMLDAIGFESLDKLLKSTVPSKITLGERLHLDEPLSESEALKKLKVIMSKNKVMKSFIGTGYYETITPGVILRNVRPPVIAMIFTPQNGVCRFWKILDGTLHTRLTKLRLLKAVCSRCLTFKQWLPT